VSSLLLALFLYTGTAWGQAGTTAVFGEVTDPQGAAVVGAKVTLTNPATGISRTDDTDGTGRYQFLGLPPGIYNLKVEMQGFRTAVREKIELLVNTQTKLNITLELGAITETVQVTEAASVLNTTNASIGNVINNTQVQNIPIEARNVAYLLSLQTGATFLPTGDMRSGAISGARSDQSNITLDGIDLNDPQGQQGAYQGAYRISQETLQEFRVTTSSFDATTGRSSSAQVTLVSKSGSNEYHGGVFWYHRNTATSSNEYFNKLSQGANGQPNKPPKLNKHLFGGSAGGPIVKDRVFVFGSFEGNRQKFETFSTRAVPSATLRDGILIYQCATGPGPDGVVGTADDIPCPTVNTTVTGLSGTTYTIPAGFFGVSPAQFAAIDPIQLGPLNGIVPAGPNAAAIAYFQQFPLPNRPGRDGRTVGGITFGNIMEYGFKAPLENIQYNYDIKFDFKLDPQGNHSVFWRAGLQDDSYGGEPQFPGQPPATLSLLNPKVSVIGYTAVLNPHLVNTFRYGYVFYKSENAGQQTFSASTFRFLSTFTPLTSTNARYFQTHNLVDDVSWTRGSHTFQFGTNIRFSRLPRFTNGISFHQAIANGSWVTGVGRRFMPGRSTCTTPGCFAVPAVLSANAASWADTSIVLWGILTQGNARYNYRTDGSILAEGAPVHRRYASNEFEFYAQDTWRFKSNLTFTYGVRWSVYSPPWETGGQQVAPRPGFGEWFELRRQAMLAGRGSNSVQRISFDLAGPVNGGKGFYDWDLNNFSPRASVAWTPRFSDGVLGWITGNGKMVLRGGYSLIFDRIGQALATSFDSGGSFGMSTQLTSPFGGCDEGYSNPCPRFTAFNQVPGPPLIQPAPPGGFPATPPFGLFAITNSIDDSNVTPYAHSVNFTIGRELPWNLSFEASYVGRFGRKLLTRRDLSMPLDIVINGRSYFQAASALAAYAEQGDPIGFSVGAHPTSVATDPFWENLYPGMIGNPICDVYGLGAAAYTTATMAVYDAYLCFAPDYTTTLQFLDQGASPSDPVGLCTAFGSCSRLGPYTFFSDQYSALAGQSTIGRANYNAFQLTVRKRMSNGLQFDFNYTLAKSLDMTSEVERGANFGDFFGGGYSEFLVNSWQPELNYSHSTFDVRHQINLNWIYELPFGRNRWLGKDVPGWADQIIGNWSVSGLMRWTSGFPFNVINCRSCWPTNWNLQGNASLFGTSFPETTRTKNAIGGLPSPFVGPSSPVTTLNDPNNPVSFFRRSRPGEIGFRNVLRGDGYYNWDLGVLKTFPITERWKLKFRWEIFNAWNTVRFNTGNISATPDLVSSFGRYNSTLATCDGSAGRCMQFALRLEF
jgi:hypothetical protein